MSPVGHDSPNQSLKTGTPELGHKAMDATVARTRLKRDCLWPSI